MALISFLQVTLSPRVGLDLKSGDVPPISARVWVLLVASLLASSLTVVFFGHSIVAGIGAVLGILDPRIYWCVLFTLLVVLSVYGVHNHVRFRVLEVSALWRPRSEYEFKYADMLARTEKCFVALGITLASVKSEEFLKALSRKLADNPDFVCDLAVVDPDAGLLTKREVDEGHSGGRLSGDVRNRLTNLFRIKADIGSAGARLRVRLLQSVPSMFIVMGDQEIAFSPYLHLDGKQSFAFLVRTAPKGRAIFGLVKGYAENLIANAKPLEKLEPLTTGDNVTAIAPRLPASVQGTTES